MGATGTRASPLTGDIVSPAGRQARRKSPATCATAAPTTRRMGAVACWNSVMDENQYMVRKWNEFIAS